MEAGILDGQRKVEGGGLCDPLGIGSERKGRPQQIFLLTELQMSFFVVVVFCF